jgi:hypothetical protein
MEAGGQAARYRYHFSEVSEGGWNMGDYQTPLKSPLFDAQFMMDFGQLENVVVFRR